MSGSKIYPSSEYTWGMAFDFDHLMVFDATSEAVNTSLSFLQYGWTFISMNMESQVVYSSTDFKTVSSGTFKSTFCECSYGSGYVTFGGMI